MNMKSSEVLHVMHSPLLFHRWNCVFEEPLDYRSTEIGVRFLERCIQQDQPTMSVSLNCKGKLLAFLANPGRQLMSIVQKEQILRKANKIRSI